MFKPWSHLISTLVIYQPSNTQLIKTNRIKKREDTEIYSGSLFRPRFELPPLFLMENVSTKDFQ
jgi:hypothetical protein